MILKDFISKFSYDQTHPILFKLKEQTYTYFDLLADSSLLKTEFHSFKIKCIVSELTEEDLYKNYLNDDTVEVDIDILLPANSHYYLIIVEIN